MRRAGVRVVLVVLLVVCTTLLTARAQTVERSLDEWLATQGTFCFPDGAGGCVQFVAPLPNQLGVGDQEENSCAYVDYAGLANDYIEAQSGGAISLGTTVTGSIKERTTSAGSAEITVRLVTSDALIFAVSGCNLASGPILFGRRAQEVLAGATPALADVTLIAKYTTPTLGAPLEDLVKLNSFPSTHELLNEVRIDADGSGELRAAFGVPDGTPGTIDLRSRAHLTKMNGKPNILEDIKLSVE
jgi:hypothetical protein